MGADSKIDSADSKIDSYIDQVKKHRLTTIKLSVFYGDEANGILTNSILRYSSLRQFNLMRFFTINAHV